MSNFLIHQKQISGFQNIRNTWNFACFQNFKNLVEPLLLYLKTKRLCKTDETFGTLHIIMIVPSRNLKKCNRYTLITQIWYYIIYNIFCSLNGELAIFKLKYTVLLFISFCAKIYLLLKNGSTDLFINTKK